MRWVHKAFGWVPVWTTQPDLTIIERLAHEGLRLVKGGHCRASSFAEGGFNKLFRIDSSKGVHLFRVALPVYPSYKTRSEVATILWLHKHNIVPVPTIIAYDATSTNDLGFEWILMEMIPGRTLHQAWRCMSSGEKEDLVRQVASYQTKLLQYARFSCIGNIYTTNDRGKSLSSLTQELSSKQFQIGPMVSTSFFWADRSNLDQKRGPFSDSKSWLSTRLRLLLEDLKDSLKEIRGDENADEDDAEEVKRMLEGGEDLENAFSELFCPCEPNLEVAILWHDDLSLMNIIVNDSNEIVGIVDWEAVSVLPAWYSKRFPAFLEGYERKTEPDRGVYAKETAEERADAPLDKQGTTSLYWEHLLEYEQTILRQTYLTEMERLNPGFMRNRESVLLQSGFEYAITQGDNPFMLGKIRSWLSDIRRGVVRDLTRYESVDQ